MIEVFSAPLNEDLSGFTKLLWELNITHRVVFEENQILLVKSEENAQLVNQMYQYWLEHDQLPAEFKAQVSNQQQQQRKSQQRLFGRPEIKLKRIPVVLCLLLISLALSMFTEFGADTELLKYFTITDFQLMASQVHYYSLDNNFETGELWRFISPIFIHFNIAHIAFNSLWIWMVGSAIEQQHKSYTLLFIALFSGIASNVAQYYVSGPIFGGLSGVVYAVISYAWAWDKLKKNRPLSVVSNGLMGFMIAWLVMGYSGLLSQLGLGNIANTAHLAGLVSGLLSVAFVCFVQSLFIRKKV